MNWFKQLIYRWSQEGERSWYQGGKGSHVTSLPESKSSNDSSFNNATNIALFKAVGGHIIKFHFYDEATDEYHETLYIIAEEDDFNNALGKILTLEALKR